MLRLLGIIFRPWLGIPIFLRWFRRDPCQHPDIITDKWIEDDTCMISVECPDCNFRDRGHVYADPSTWPDE